MKYDLNELWERYRDFCNATQVGNETSVGAFFAYLEYQERLPDELRLRP